MKETSNWIVGLGKDIHEYKVNGVTYIVSSRFDPPFKNNPTLSERMKRIVIGEFVHLINKSPANTMEDEYVCSDCIASKDARKED